MSAHSQAAMHQLIITGPPGVGKTTLVKSVADWLQRERPNCRIGGFYTQETRDQRGNRSGFKIISIPSGDSASLATTSPSTRGPKVGKYTVTVDAFESLALQPFSSADQLDVLVLDELGKMESFSAKFCSSFLDWLHTTAPHSNTVAPHRRAFLLATVPSKPAVQQSLAIVSDVIKMDPNKERALFHLSTSNRDKAVEEICERIVRVLDKIGS